MLAEVEVLALVAVTVIGKVPVPAVLFELPPHPATASTSAEPMVNAASVIRTRLLRILNAASPMRASSAAYGVSGPGSLGDTFVDAGNGTLIVMVTCELSWFSDDGLKLHVAPAGSPLQAKVIAPRLLLESTLNTVEVVPPRVTVRFVTWAVIWSGAPM